MTQQALYDMRSTGTEETSAFALHFIHEAAMATRIGAEQALWAMNSAAGQGEVLAALPATERKPR